MFRSRNPIARSVFETLEARRLLSGGGDERHAKMDGHTLIVRGTAGDDIISLSTDGITAIVVIKNVELFNVPLADVGRIEISGNAGNDQLLVNNSNGAFTMGVRFFGGTGNDTITGGGGRDYLFGGDGMDVLNGDGGSDVLVGGAQKDTLFGGAGNDRMEGNGGNDYLDGGSGNDELRGQGGVDVLLGGEGNDHLDGGGGTDELNGGRGDDRCKGGSGDDVITISAGGDTFDHKDKPSEKVTPPTFDELMAGPGADEKKLEKESKKDDKKDEKSKKDKEKSDGKSKK